MLRDVYQENDINVDKRCKALVVFHDGGAQRTARFLKPGFRHVYVALLADHGWIVVEGVKEMPTVQIACGPDEDLKEFFEDRGLTVVEVMVGRRRPLFAIGSCVGLVKAFLGIRKPWIVTPHQLYRYLRKRHVCI